MYKEKPERNVILNSNLLLFFMLCLFGVLYLSIVVNYWYFLFLILVPFTIRKVEIKWQQIIFYLFLFVIFSFLIIFATEFSLFSLISKGLKNIGANIIKNSMLNYFDKIYSQETSSFIKLILFNIKSDQTIIFYKQTVDLGIVWLIGISGFHISLLVKIFKKIFIKVPRVGKYFTLVFVLFYSFLLNFSYASMRILFKIAYEWIFNKFKIEKKEKLGMIGLTIALLNPLCFQSFSFMLSFVICIGAYFVNSLELNNKILQSLCLNITAFLLTIPFVIEMNHKISLLTFINAFVFTYFSSFVFLYFLVFAWIPFMAIIHYGIIVACYVLIGNISFGNIYIYSKSWPIWANFLFYGGIMGISRALYLIVFNNKI